MSGGVQLVHWEPQWLIAALADAFRRHGMSIGRNHIAVDGMDGVGKGEFKLRLMSDGRVVLTQAVARTMWPTLGGRAYAHLATLRGQSLDELQKRVLAGPRVAGVPYLLFGRAVYDQQSGEAMLTARIVRVQTASPIASESQVGVGKSAESRAGLAAAAITGLLQVLRHPRHA